MNSMPFSPISGMILTIAVSYVFIFLIGALLLWWLWNITMPQIFGVKKITPFEALRLLIISLILLGGGPLFLFNVWH